MIDDNLFYNDTKMFYWKIFYNKEIAEMVYEYLKSIFWDKANLELRNWQYNVTIDDPDLTYLTDIQKEMVKFLMPHIFNH